MRGGQPSTVRRLWLHHAHAIAPPTILNCGDTSFIRVLIPGSTTWTRGSETGKEMMMRIHSCPSALLTVAQPPSVGCYDSKHL